MEGVQCPVSALEIGGKKGKANPGQAEGREGEYQRKRGNTKGEGIDTFALLEPSVSLPSQGVVGAAS